MKAYILLILLSLYSAGFAQTIPADSLYLAQVRPGTTPVVFPLQSSPGLRPVERIAVSSDGKEIYYGELDTWPANTQRVKCYKYLSNRWQGPFIVFEGFVGPALSVNDSIMYMQKDTLGVACTYYSMRTGSGWSYPSRLLTSNLQSHYFQQTNSKNCYLASTPAGGSDICRLVINNNDTLIQSLGKPINNTSIENDFFVARDESFIIFFRLSSPYDLFISYHKSNGKWTNPKSLGANINTNIYECCPYVTSDNKYLFFTRGASAMNSYYTYWVKVDGIIDSLRHTNFVPYLNYQIPEQSDSVGRLYTYTFPDSTFIDDDGNNTLTYTAAQTNGSPLPSWLDFNPATRTFSGTPVTAGAVGIKVTARDSANMNVTCIFALNIIQNTAINPVNGNIASEYKLFQNYPNPFNPSTKISYSLINRGHVVLKLYSVLGKEIFTLVNANQDQGIYEYNLDMNRLNLSSGAYIYTITVTDAKMNYLLRESKILNYIK